MLSDTDAIIDKAGYAGGISKVKLFNTIPLQYTRRAETKAGFTLTHNIHITSSKHLHKKSKEAQCFTGNFC